MLNLKVRITNELSYNTVLITKLLSLFIIFLLLFLFNVEVDIDGFYFLGGSNTDCSMGVAGVFKLEFLVLLFLVDIILILMLVLIWSVKHLKYLLIMSLINFILLVLAIYLKQPRLFKGYELTHHTNLLDALTGKCYLFYGVHDGVLALTIFLNVAMIIWYYN